MVVRKMMPKPPDMEHIRRAGAAIGLKMIDDAQVVVLFMLWYSDEALAEETRRSHKNIAQGGTA